jgi:predicted PurR-regulated permease PerM
MITSKTIANGILRAITVIVLTALLLYFLPNFICISILNCCLNPLIGNPVLDFFTRRLKFNHIFATIATLFIFVIVISGFIMMFIPLILSQGQNLSFKYWRYRAADHSISKPNKRFFRKSSYWFIKILKASDISSKINFNIIPNF